MSALTTPDDVRALLTKPVGYIERGTSLPPLLRSWSTSGVLLCRIVCTNLDEVYAVFTLFFTTLFIKFLTYFTMGAFYLLFPNLWH